MSISVQNLTVEKLPEFIYLAVSKRDESFVYKYQYPKVINQSNSQDYEGKLRLRFRVFQNFDLFFYIQIEKARFDPEIFFNILLPPVVS